jgi:hypothetical protein
MVLKTNQSLEHSLLGVLTGTMPEGGWVFALLFLAHQFNDYVNGEPLSTTIADTGIYAAGVLLALTARKRT